MKSTSPLDGIFKKLATKNISEKYVREVALPVWWEDSAATSPIGLAQAASYIASKLGLDVLSLLEDGPVNMASRQMAFKKPKDAKDETLEIDGAIASQAAEISISAAPETTLSLPSTAQEWRSQVIERAGQVSFQSLLLLCWEYGIAVLTLTGDALPTPKKGRPHGLAAHFDNRFAIVLMGGTEHKHTAWQLFRLAHEIGHIARGHLKVDSTIFDEKIGENARDPQEVEADNFATELLFGGPLQTTGSWVAPDRLVTWANQNTAKYCVEPGALVLNWAQHEAAQGCGQKCWATATNALKDLNFPDAHSLIREGLEVHLLWDELGQEEAAFLRRINALEAPAPFSTSPAKAAMAA